MAAAGITLSLPSVRPVVPDQAEGTTPLVGLPPVKAMFKRW
ncbi:hypothetical protein MNBD_ALPHA04-2037 [hydrothermal vent metagenome]|uniref:Uncharacterized protein n=1 Tax=hydrothermal vent metagenome TaxID=652676 RepID=A0A3B0TEV1_9ZZZZ